MLNILLCFISGLLLSLAFPSANLHWVSWFALVPLMYSIYRVGWKQAIICGMAFGVGFFGSLIYWLSIFGTLPWALVAIWQALYIVAFVVISKFIGSRLAFWGRLALLPAVWVALEWVRSLGGFGFTWGDLGYSQYKALSVAQIASVTGVWGVSFVLALSNAALANLLLAAKAPRKPSIAYPQMIAAGLLILAIVLHGISALNTPISHKNKELRVAIIQGNVSQDTDSVAQYSLLAWKAYEPMTISASRKGADLIVWPETVVPECVGQNPFLQSHLTALAGTAKANFLVGGWDERAGGREVLNSAFLVKPGYGIIDRYAKVHLVPFGEYVPAREFLPFLSYYRVRTCDTTPGSGYKVMNEGDYKIGTVICFESAFPDIARRMAVSGANLLCVITDDEWFGNGPAAEQHLSMSVFRAIENHRYLLRGASTGISCVIDPNGRVLSRTKMWSQAVINQNVWLQTNKTFYTRHGNWLVYLSLGIMVLFASRYRRKSVGKEQKNGDL